MNGSVGAELAREKQLIHGRWKIFSFTALIADDSGSYFERI